MSCLRLPGPTHPGALSEWKVPQAQIIQGDEEGGPVRYYAELPRKAHTAAGWLEDVNVRRDTLTLTVRSDAVMPDVGVDVRL